MAKRFRLDALPQNLKDQLGLLLQQYIPNIDGKTHEGILDALEKTGRIPDEIFKKLNFSEESKQTVLARFNDLFSGIPSRQAAIQPYLRSGFDESMATDEEIQNRLQAFEEFPGTLRKQTDVDGLRNKIRETLTKRLGRTSGDDPTVYESILNRFLADPNFSTDNPEIKQKYRASIDEVRQSIGNYLPETKDVSGEVSKLKKILETRNFEAGRTKAIGDYLTSRREEFGALREEYLSGASERTEAEFLDYIPEAIGQINSRGMLFSGEPEDLLTSKAVSLQGGLEDLRSQLETEDNQFYFDAAYEAAITKQLSARTDYQDAIRTERERIMGERNRSFSSKQGDYDRQLQSELAWSDLQRNYDLNRTRLASEKRASKTAKRDQLFSDIASSAASSVTTGLTANATIKNVNIDRVG